MKFEDTGLPHHPVIEKCFDVLRQYDKGDTYTTRGILIAKLIENDSVNKEPESIAAGLLVPLAQDLGPFLCARADLPGRVPDIITAVFTFGRQSMTGMAMDKPYEGLEAAVRPVVLASSIRMFEVTAEDLERSGAKGADAATLKAMLLPVKDFTELVARNEKTETALAAKCQAAMKRIEDCLDGAGIKLTPAAKPRTPKP